MIKKDWFRPRSYLHFDNKTSIRGRNRIQEIVSDPHKVATHSFFPFLSYEKDKPKIVADPTTGKRFFKMGKRPICYAAHLDFHIYAYYSKNLSNAYDIKLKEFDIDENIIAFRKLTDPATGKSKCNIHLANEAFDEIIRYGNCKVFAFDIKSFFDTIDGDLLKAKWSAILNVNFLPKDHYTIFKTVTKFNVVERDKALLRFGISKRRDKQMQISRICSIDDFREIVRKENMIERKNKGIPQGSPISATLANIYMLDFDNSIASKVKCAGGKYFRYCDDILCILPSHSDLRIDLSITEELSKLNLKLNEDKTDISVFSLTNGTQICDRPIQYLGFIFDGKAKSLRPSSISFFRKSAKSAINRAVSMKIASDRYNESRGKPKRPIHLRLFFKNYTHHGKRTYITYGRRAQEIMKSEAIRLQLSGLDKFLQNEVKWARSI